MIRLIRRPDAMKLFLFVLLLISASATVCAQQLPRRALKFDEFVVPTEADNYWPSTALGVQDHVQRLVKRIRRMPGSHVTIITYRKRTSERESEEVLSSVEYATKDGLRSIRWYDYGSSPKIEGGFRDRPTVEYWIVPKGAAEPIASPKYPPESGFECPSIYLTEDMNFSASDPAVFRVSLNPKVASHFKWSTSKGDVIDGQGMDSVKVDLKGATKATITVEAEDLPITCRRAVIEDFTIGPRPYLSEYVNGYNRSYLSALIDATMVVVNNDPTITAYLIGYVRRPKDDRVVSNYSYTLLRQLFAIRRYSMDRVRIIDGGVRDTNSVEIWLVPPGAEAPKSTPSADSSFFRSTTPRKVPRAGPLD
jgi:hypothetical protein